MSPRTALFGLFAILGLLGQTAQAAAAPPASPLVEGREPDPVAREHYQPDQPIAGYVSRTGPRPEAAARGSC